ncbi:unnamed protein product [Bemisia tabaci]|uniref:VWFC domain-containing protein n=2 Tax=Bemisia tabaci TaxID=7038 RepID=A0A9P0C4R1_BEMTA|nr:unnamed protein product [Bemisia tabaci]
MEEISGYLATAHSDRLQHSQLLLSQLLTAATRSSRIFTHFPASLSNAMIPVKSFALLCLWPALQAWQIPESCDYISLYREMGCTPIFESGKECPVAYNCDKFTKVDPKSCYYNGNTYQKGYQLNDTETMDHCHYHCRCRDSYPQTAHAEWACALGECFFLPEKGCVINQYNSLKDCCRNRTYCEGVDPKPAITCAYKGVTYIEGQIMYDETKCKRCICNADFKDTLEGPSCETQRCGTMLHNMQACERAAYQSTIRALIVVAQLKLNALSQLTPLSQIQNN